ncbi:substrate-binding domain-containing protein [Limimaricola sp.]|uniref:substrate-binding domain-containing protein n=1 Tax=Limimaricola sp. TaxID=2211665 RepID=UPI0025BF9828|nr:substrate-binding domain-containing protein [Limimaricola sp.]
MMRSNRTWSGHTLRAALLGGALAALSATGAWADQPFILEVGGPLSDPFFSTFKRGGDDAAAAEGVRFEFTAPNGFDNLSQDLAKLIEVGITRKPDAMVIGDFIPDAEDPGIKAAVAAGIVVVIVNTGADSWEDDGAIAFVGQDEALAGREAARAFLAAGVKNAVCVNHVPGNPGTQARCDGMVAAMTEAGAKGTAFNLPYSDSGNPQQVKQAIMGTLTADSTIDGVFTLGSGIAEQAMQAVASAGLGGNVQVGTTDISTNTLNAVKSGDLLFDIDQQPYLQGYYGVLIAAQRLKYGLQPIGMIKTGPMVIDKTNVDAVLEAQKLGVRGAG